MTYLRLSFLITSIFMFLLALDTAADAAEVCPKVPAVSWWGDTSAQGLGVYVESKHGGDWDAYVNKWQRYENKLRAKLRDGQSVTIKSQNITLQGKELADHINLISKRIEATNCFAAQAIEARLIGELNNMDTAAGGNTQPEFKAQTANGCAQFPKVVWWNVTHAKVISYVAKKHDGDWRDYVTKWFKQFEKMKELSERGGTAVLKSKKMRLEGEDLLQYVDAIKDRLAVTRCLARREMANFNAKKKTPAKDG